MVVVLDFGSVLNKALIFDEGRFDFYRFSISYVPQSFNVKNLLESLKKLEVISGKNFLGQGGKTKESLYLTSSLPLTSEIRSFSPIRAAFSTGEALGGLPVPVLELGFRFAHYGSHLRALSEPVAEEILKWLPFKISLVEVQNYLHNKYLYASTLPIFPRDLYLEKAIAREKLSELLLSDFTFGEAVVLSGGVFSICPGKNQALQIFLDAFDGSSALEVFLDIKDISPILGVLNLSEPDVLASLPEELQPVSLGRVFRFSGGVNLKIDSGLGEPQEVEIEKERLFVYPLTENETAELTFARSFDRRRRSQGESVHQVAGGHLGVVVDCRTRPLNLPADSGQRIEQLKIWEEQLGTLTQLKSS